LNQELQIMETSTRKKAFVTGGSRGIGRGIVLGLAGEGYDTAFTYNSAFEEAKLLKGECEAVGALCHFFQASMEIDGVPEKVSREALTALGGIDVLVCNAGLTRHDSILSLTEEHIDFVYKLNFRSYMMCARVAAEHMVQRGVPGRILFISSTRALRAHPEDNIYGSLKAGLIRSVQTLSLELAEYGITVNCIAPGATKIRGDLSKSGLTKGNVASLVPLGRLGSPEEVADLATFLVSEKASYITGETVRIDGGLILPGQKESPD